MMCTSRKADVEDLPWRRDAVARSFVFCGYSYQITPDWVPRKSRFYLLHFQRCHRCLPGLTKFKNLANGGYPSQGFDDLSACQDFLPGYGKLFVRQNAGSVQVDHRRG
jgi:hypothetical protein